MDLREQNILFFTRTMKLGGTENVVLQLCEVFQPLVQKIVVCSCGGINVQKLERMGIKHYEIPDIENKSPKTIFAVCKKIKNIVEKERITVVHTHHRMAAFYVTLLGLYKKCLFLNTSHNTFADKLGFTRFAYKHANLIACGEMVKNNLVKVFGLLEEKVTVIHNAVKPFDGNVIIDPLIQELHNQGYFIVGNVGRLSEQKGMEYYVQAIPNILRSCPNVKFLIVGSGESEEKLRALAERLQVIEHLYFLGYRTDVQNVMSQMDLIVLSSLWEGLPLTPIEAFSVEKTVIGTAVDGTVEIIENEKSGFLITPRKSDEIAEKIIWLIEHQEEHREMEKYAHMRYQEKFSFEQFAINYKKYYEELLYG